jgi:hypothetical protein
MLSADKNDDLKQNENEKEMSRLINETTTSLLRIYNAYGPQAVEDWEVNELLEWTHNLNYDDYLLDWRTIGTSGSSNVIYGRFFFEIMKNKILLFFLLFY